MAGIFAPKLQSEVAYERPVETPSALGAIAGLGEFFLKDYSRGRAEEAKQQAKRSSSVDPNLAVFQQGLEKVEAIREQSGENAALLAERQLAKNFAMAGIEFDTDYENVYSTTTGRPWAGYGRDNEALMREEMFQDADFQASYVGSFAVLPKDATEEQRIEYAFGQKAALAASSDVIARSKAESGYTWTVETEAAYSKAIDTFVNTNLGSLVATTQQGGRLGPQVLANLEASWTQMKVGISRPSGISDDQWKSTQNKINNIDNMLTTLNRASSSDVLFEEITTAMANTLISEGEGSTTSLLAAMTAIKDPASLTNLMGGNVETFIMDVGRGINLDITQPDLFSHVLEQSTGNEGEGGVVDLTELPDGVKEKVAGLSPQEYFNALKASGQLAALIEPNALQRPEGREQFVENAAGIGAVLMSMENDQFLSADFLKKLVANPQFLRNVATLDTTDPEGAAVARSFVVSGLNTELARQQRNLAALENNLGATWDGNKYVITRESIMASGNMTEQQADGFLAWVNKTYGGNTEMLADGRTPLPEGMGFNPQGLSAAYERRKSMGIIRDTVSILKPEQDPTQTVDTGASDLAREAVDSVQRAITSSEIPTVQGMKDNPFVFEGTTDEEGAAFYEGLPSGAFFVDPADGRTYRKP